MSKKNIGITFFGDSIMKFKKKNLLNDWTKLVKKKLLKNKLNKFFFYSKIIVGINSRDVLNLLPNFFLKIKNKDILIFQIGINDSWHYKSLKGLPIVELSSFRKNLNEIYKKSKIAGFKKIIFINYHKLLNNRIEVNGKSLNQNLYKYNNEIRLFCKKKKIYLININNLAKKIKKNFCLPMPDGIHLNKKGVKFYSKNVFEHLIKIINEQKI